MALLRRTTKTKKSPFKFTEETPQPSLTRGTTVTQGRDVQRIDLTNNKKFAEYATKAKQRETEPIFTRSSNGAFTGVKFPDGREFQGLTNEQVQQLTKEWRNRPLSVEEQIQSELDRTKLKEQMIAEQTPERVSQEQLDSLTDLTPEQLAIAQGSANLNTKPDLKMIGAIAGERAALGATSGALGGAGVGAVAGGVGAIPGAIVGGIGGAITGGVSGIFGSYKNVASSNVNQIEDNIMTAQNNLAKARTLANQGASYEEVKMNVGDAVAQLDLAERQLYEASKSKYEYKTNARDKLAKLRQYKREIMPDQIALIELALQKPTPEYINGGGQ